MCRRGSAWHLPGQHVPVSARGLALYLVQRLMTSPHSQKISVNGAEQGSLAGLRAPPSNNPVYDTTSDSIICGASGTTSNTVVPAQPGDKIGVWFQHIIGGPQVG